MILYDSMSFLVEVIPSWLKLSRPTQEKQARLDTEWKAKKAAAKRQKELQEMRRPRRKVEVTKMDPQVTMIVSICFNTKFQY